MRITSISAAAALALAALVLPGADAEAPPIIIKGNRFFNSVTGKEFRLKGMAYYPRPNGGEFANVGNYDWAADDYEDVWLPHLEIMVELGVNTIRLYSVDPSRPHDKFMCACAERGIYVIIGMTAPCENCSVQDALPPACYPPELLERIQMVYNAMAVYDNTLAFSVGNENNLQIKYGKEGTATAPCVKSLLRDARAFASDCAGEGLRQVPIGLDIADIPPREQWLQYYDCVIDGDSNTRADWIGFNPYVECNPLEHKTYADSVGLQQLMKEYDEVAYSRPIMFGEFGCNEGENTIDGYENQRGFYDAKWMNDEPEMTEQIVGGNVFEFTTEVANLFNEKVLSKEKDPGKYGVGYFQPDDCDHDAIPCEFVPYPEFENLKTAYTTTKESTLTMDAYNPPRSDAALECPKGNISAVIPPMPPVNSLSCSTAVPTCGRVTATKYPTTMLVPTKANVTQANETAAGSLATSLRAQSLFSIVSTLLVAGAVALTA